MTTVFQHPSWGPTRWMTVTLDPIQFKTFQIWKVDISSLWFVIHEWNTTTPSDDGSERILPVSMRYVYDMYALMYDNDENDTCLVPARNSKISLCNCSFLFLTVGFVYDLDTLWTDVLYWVLIFFISLPRIW